MELTNLFISGGFIMYPLLICSFVMWAVILEKFWTIAWFKISSRRVYNKVEELMSRGDKDSAIEMLRKDGMVRNPYRKLLEIQTPKSGVGDPVQRKLKETQSDLKRLLWALGTIGSSAPFIGLFGTVVGIIKSFDAMAISGKGGFAVVAAGLSEALIATAAGIIVAVIALMFYNYFVNKLNSVNQKFRHDLEDLADLIRENEERKDG